MQIILNEKTKCNFENEFKFMLVDGNKIIDESAIPYTKEKIKEIEEQELLTNLTQIVEELV